MRRQRGLTLLELLIAITVLGILVGIGAPGLRELVLNNRQAGAINELIASLQSARSEAITRNVGAPAVVSVCASNNGTSCGGSWSEGWIVFTDANGPAAANVDEVLRAAEGPVGITVTMYPLPTAISYRRDGRTLSASDFVFCDDRGASRARVVQLGISGRPAISKSRSNGSDPTCS